MNEGCPSADGYDGKGSTCRTGETAQVCVEGKRRQLVSSTRRNYISSTTRVFQGTSCNVPVGRALGETCEMPRDPQHLDQTLFVVPGEGERIRKRAPFWKSLLLGTESGRNVFTNFTAADRLPHHCHYKARDCLAARSANPGTLLADPFRKLCEDHLDASVLGAFHCPKFVLGPCGRPAGRRTSRLLNEI